MSSTYLDRVFYFYKKIWKAEGLSDIIKMGFRKTTHPQKWYDVFSFLLATGTVVLWLIIAIALNPIICLIGSIKKPKPRTEFFMAMDGCGQHGKSNKSVDPDDDLPF